MPGRLMLVTVFVTALGADLSSGGSQAQSPEEPPPASIPLAESPAPPLIPQPDEHLLSPSPLQEQDDAVMVLGELRSAVRSSPKSAEDRLNLAQGLYRLGDVDAAIDECRMAIRLDPGDANAHLQLGVLFIMKQEWRAALSVLKEAVRLNPPLTHAHYSLGNVQYALGAVNAAIQSYRQVLELQPHFPDGRYRLTSC